MKLSSGKARNFHLSLSLFPPPHEYCLPFRMDFYCRVSLRAYTRKFCARKWKRSNVWKPCVNVQVERDSIVALYYQGWSAYLPDFYLLLSLPPTVTGIWSIVAGGVIALAMMHRVARLHVCLAFIFSVGNSTPTCFSLTEKGAGAGRSLTQQRGSHFMKKNRSLSHSWLEYPRCNRDWRSCAPCLEKTQCCACERRASSRRFKSEQALAALFR